MSHSKQVYARSLSLPADWRNFLNQTRCVALIASLGSPNRDLRLVPI